MTQHGCMFQVMQNMMLVTRETMVQTIATTAKPEANLPLARIEEDIDTDILSTLVSGQSRAFNKSSPPPDTLLTASCPAAPSGTTADCTRHRGTCTRRTRAWVP